MEENQIQQIAALNALISQIPLHYFFVVFSKLSGFIQKRAAKRLFRSNDMGMVIDVIFAIAVIALAFGAVAEFKVGI